MILCKIELPPANWTTTPITIGKARRVFKWCTNCYSYRDGLREIFNKMFLLRKVNIIRNWLLSRFFRKSFVMVSSFLSNCEYNTENLKVLLKQTKQENLKQKQKNQTKLVSNIKLRIYHTWIIKLIQSVVFGGFLTGTNWSDDRVCVT